MPLFLKTHGETQRSLYLYFPGEKNRTPFRQSSITFLLDSCTRADVEHILYECGMKELADREQIILSFPIPKEGGWNYTLTKEWDDARDIMALQYAMDRPDDDPIKLNELGIPLLSEMLRTWHPMNDTKYLVGMGTGASMAYTMAACYPDNIAAVLCIGGQLDEKVKQQAVQVPMTIYMVDAPEATEAYFVKANEALPIEAEEGERQYRNPVNPLQKIISTSTQEIPLRELLYKVWESFFCRVRRTNTGAHGDLEPRMNIEEAKFEYFIEDSRLDGTPHTWFTHVPEQVKKGNKKVPLMLFCHGGSDNPAEAADMSKLHELGDQEGFITVYPWGSDRCGWSISLEPGQVDDVGYLVKLITYMLTNYPIDPQRVYLSGFSNGAAMAQVVALLHPEMIAAICHIDSNWPGKRIGGCQLDWREVIPFARAMEIKEERGIDYRIPVWYTYGTREASYPVYEGCSQQHQYDFWKLYNHIEIRPTPGKDNPEPSGCGVKGDITERLTPSQRHPHHVYEVQRFFSQDSEPKNYYNYVMMRDKGHEVAQMDPVLGWNYVKQFKRNSDGSIGTVPENGEEQIN